MLNNKKIHYVHLILIILTIMICVYQSLVKGWFSFALIPLSVFVLPIYAFFGYKSLNTNAGPYKQWIRLTGYLLTFFVLIFYVGTVGIGDTDRVLLFGFYNSTDTSQVTQISENASRAAFLLGPATLLLLIVLLIVNNKKKSNKTK
ncbi:MAG: hypothetical protein NTV95_03605 [Candidatus Saccharibacteria bacterium]|nr:hypothetical protein [Candidatus Saccharibacteria bacterium]